MSTVVSATSLVAQMSDRANFPILSLPPGSFFVSEVLDNLAWYGTVIVGVPMGGPIQGVPLQEGSGVWGPRKIGAAYPPHTQVVCYRPVGAPYCFILGAIPNWITSAKFNKVPSWVVMASQSGFGFDPIHSERIKRLQGNQGDINFSAGRPCDELPGDYGHVNEFGAGYGIGRMMTWLRASHFCGVEAHWIDNLLRLTGYNLEQLTAASERRMFDDEGEWNDVDRWSPYPWESRGVASSSDDFTEKGDGEWNQAGSPRAGREPQFEDQMGIWRVQRFRGYLGDLERTIVALPDPQKFSEGPERMINKTTMHGLLDVGYTTDGRYHIRSARGISLEKTVTIPVPKELIAPDDPLGDNATNYKAAGAYGNGEEHTKSDVTLDDDQPGLRALMRLERHSLLHTFYDNLGFFRHENDWHLPNEEETLTETGLSHGLYQGEDDVTDGEFWMPLPKSVQKSVDHRGNARFFVGRAAIEIEEDGSVNVEDAYGSQVRLEGGNAFVTARNDVIMQPGRNFTVLAPNDIIMRAGHSVDISGSKGDVRIKAEGNLMMAANTKGVLIEAKDVGGAPDWSELGENIESRGVLIKALHSSVISMSKDTYIRAGVRSEDSADGELHIDAGGGLGMAYVHGGTITNRALTKAEFIVGSTGDSDATASMDLRPQALVVGGRSLQNVSFGGTNFSFGHEDYDSSFNILGNAYVDGRLWARKDAIIDRAVLCGQNLICQNGIHVGGNTNIFTGQIVCKQIAADDSNNFLPATGDDFNASDQTPPAQPTSGTELLDADRERLRNALRAARGEDNETVTELQEKLYGEDSRFASNQLIEAAVFTFRTPEDYGTEEGFVLFESRWQQYNRLLFSKNKPWQEVAIVAPDSERQTMPYPGYEVWEEQNALITMNHAMFDFGLGVARNRQDIEDNELGDRKSKKLADGYVVTLQNGTLSGDSDG